LGLRLITSHKYILAYSCNEFCFPDNLYYVLKAEVQKHDNGALDVGTVLDSSNGISDKAGGWHPEFELSPQFSSLNHINPQPGLNSESKDVGTGFAMLSEGFGELNSGSGSNQNLVSCFHISSSFCVTLFIYIIEECPLTPPDCGFVVLESTGEG